MPSKQDFRRRYNDDPAAEETSPLAEVDGACSRGHVPIEPAQSEKQVPADQHRRPGKGGDVANHVVLLLVDFTRLQAGVGRIEDVGGIPDGDQELLVFRVDHLAAGYGSLHTRPIPDESGKSIVLKLKVAPDAASGILDQYELGPYNLIILGQPSRWQGEISSFINAGVAQKVAMLSPCSVMVARPRRNGKGHLICTDGSEQSLEAARREAVLARCDDYPKAGEDSQRARCETFLAEGEAVEETS